MIPCLIFSAFWLLPSLTNILFFFPLPILFYFLLLGKFMMLFLLFSGFSRLILALHFLSIFILGLNLCPGNSLSSFFSSFFLFLHLLIILYFYLYSRKNIPFTPLTLTYFLVHFLLFLSLLWGFTQALWQEHFPLPNMSDFSLLRHYISLLIIPPILFSLWGGIKFSWEKYFPPGKITPIQEGFYLLWKDNPLGDKYASLGVDWLGKNPHTFLLPLHFFLFYFPPLLHTLLWIWVFLGEDLRPLLLGLPLILLSFLYGHLFYYFQAYVASNLRGVEKLLLIREIGPGIYHYSLSPGAPFPSSFLSTILGTLRELRSLGEILHGESPFLRNLRLFHWSLRFLVSLYLCFYFLGLPLHSSMMYSSASKNSPSFLSLLRQQFYPSLLQSHFSSSVHRINSQFEKHVEMESSGVCIANHSILVDMDIRDDRGFVLLLGELTSSRNKSHPSFLLDPSHKANGQRGEQWWIPCSRLTFVDPLSVGEVSSIPLYSQRPHIRESLDRLLSSFGLKDYSSLVHPRGGFSPIQDLLGNSSSSSLADPT